ncbi:glycerophosphodiester phosphodiesterase family protein [Arcanobacterium hippocoleae]
MLIEAVITELERLDPKREIIVSSFNHVLLEKFKQRAPKLPVGCLYEQGMLRPDWKSVLELVGAAYIHPHEADLTAQRVALCHSAGFGINTWTVNDRNRANQLANWGVDGIISNIAHELKTISGAKSVQ